MAFLTVKGSSELQPLGKAIQQFLTKLNLLYNLVFTLLGMYPSKLKIYLHANTYIGVFSNSVNN